MSPLPKRQDIFEDFQYGHSPKDELLDPGYFRFDFRYECSYLMWSGFIEDAYRLIEVLAC